MNPNQMPPIVTDEDKAIVGQMQNAHLTLTQAAVYFTLAQQAFDQWVEQKNQSRIVLA